MSKCIYRHWILKFSQKESMWMKEKMRLMTHVSEWENERMKENIMVSGSYCKQVVLNYLCNFKMVVKTYERPPLSVIWFMVFS